MFFSSPGVGPPSSNLHNPQLIYICANKIKHKYIKVKDEEEKHRKKMQTNK
jgi:hypothetical protein